MSIVLALLTVNEAFPQIQETAPTLVCDAGGHTARVTDIRLSSAGTYVVSASIDKTIRIWDVAARRTVRVIRGARGDGEVGSIWSMTTTPDDRFIFAGGEFPGDSPYSIRVHDFQTGEILQLLKGHIGSVMALAVSRDGTRLVSGDWRTHVIVWDLTKRPFEIVHEYTEPASVVGIAVSNDGKLFATGTIDGKLRLRQAESGEDILTAPLGSEVWGVAFSNDGKLLASGTWDGAVDLWSTSGSHLRQLASQPSAVLRLAFSPNDENLVSAAGYTLGDSHSCRVYRVKDGAVVLSHEYDNVASAVAVSNDGRFVATAGGDRKEIQVSDLQTRKPVATLRGTGSTIWRVGFTKDNSAIAIGRLHQRTGENQFGPYEYLFQLPAVDRSGSVASIPKGIAIFGAQTSFNDLRLRSMDSDKKPSQQYAHSTIWTEEHGKRLASFTVTESSGRYHQTFALTPDGAYVLSGGENGHISMWNSRTGEFVRAFVGHTSDVFTIAVSPDNRYLLSGASDETVKLWDLKTGNELITIFISDELEWAAWTPQAFYAASIGGDRYVGWHIDRGPDKTATYSYFQDISRSFYRPDIVIQTIRLRDPRQAIVIANEVSQGSGAVSVRDVRNLLPPVVAFDSPGDFRTESGLGTVHVRAHAVAQQIAGFDVVPVRSLRLLVNGKLTAETRSSSLRIALDAYVKLRSGDNSLAVIADNGFATSTAVRRSITLTGGDIRRFDSSNTPPSPIPSPYLLVSAQVLLAVRRPAVVVKSPEDGVSEDGEVVVNIEAIPADKPIRTITCYLNGVIVGEVKHDGGGRANAGFRVELVPGKNVIAVAASDGVATSERESRTVHYVPNKQPPKLVILAIGLSEYEAESLRLLYATEDARAVADALGRPTKPLYASSVSQVIPDAAHQDTDYRIGNRAAVLKGLNWMNAVARDDDLRILFLAGHGGLNRLASDTYFFCSKHAVAPDQEEIYDVSWTTIIDRLGAGAGPAVIFFDTCRSGSDAAGGSVRRVLKRVDDYDITVFTASGDGSPSREDAAFGGGHGAFTFALIDGLAGAADSEPKNHLIESDELGVYIRRRVIDLTKDRQRPMFRPGFNGPVAIARY